MKKIRGMEIMNWVETAHFPIIVLEVGGERQEEVEIGKGIRMDRYLWESKRGYNFRSFFSKVQTLVGNMTP